MAAQRLSRGSEKRRHRRVPVDFDALVLGADGGELSVRILDLSRGGAQLAGPPEIKNLLFRRKRYTHLPLPALLRLVHGTENAETLLGRCKYLRRLPDGSYRIGFGFAQIQAQRWLDAITSTPRAPTPRTAPPSLHQRPNPRPGSGPAPAG